MDDPLNVSQALVPGFDYDVFVSYAHGDDTLPEGTQAQFGWITALARNLNVGPNALRKRIFIDHQLRVGEDFDAGLVERVQRSATLVLVLSRGYLGSPWCGKEIDHFVRARSDDPANPQNVFVVETIPYELLAAKAQVPEPIRNLRQRRLFAKFWYAVKSSDDVEVAGYPTPTENEEGRTQYWQQCNKLLRALDDHLDALKVSQPGPAAKHPPAPSAATSAFGQSAPPAQPTVATVAPAAVSAKPSGPAVLLADTTEDLDERRNQVKIALQAEGIAVLPETDYASVPGPELESAIDADVAASHVFVQLLSPTVGKPRGARLPAPQLQFELAQRAGLPIMQWCEDKLKFEDIADAGHKALFQSGFLQTTNLERFKAEVITKHHALLREARRASAQTEQTQPTGKRRIFLDDWLSDGDLTRDLIAQLTGSGCEVHSLDPDEATDDETLIEALRSCRGGISIYPDPRHKKTLKNSLTRYLKLIAEKDIQMARWGVYFAQPVNGNDIYQEFRLASPDLLAIGAATGAQGEQSVLQKFLEGVPAQ